jgi:hypothetical protein
MTPSEVRAAAVGLIPERASTLLGDFLADFIKRRTDIKPRTRINREACQTRLVEFFGKDRSLKSITPGDADAWLLWLRERYANGTAGRTVKRAKQFFRSARFLRRQPFGRPGLVTPGLQRLHRRLHLPLTTKDKSSPFLAI